MLRKVISLFLNRGLSSAVQFAPPRVTIGSGSFVGARSLVLGNTQHKTVYAGQPAVAVSRRHVS